MGEHPLDPDSIAGLIAVVRRLRDPSSGCPWDLAQTFRTIAPYTIEEAYEVADAIDSGDPTALKDELGDLLFQVVLQAQIAEDQGLFDLADIATASVGKMTRRHPHIFAEASGIETADDQTAAWERMKALERAERGGADLSVLANVPPGLPSMTRAVKLQSRAAGVGFEWPNAVAVLDKLEEEIGELRAEIRAGAGADRIENELGDLLLAATNLARQLGLDPEAALRLATRKFERRFRAMEAILRERNSPIASLDAAGFEALWHHVKGAES